MKPGDSISHYRIVEQLGAGGMGVVYKAEDTRLKRLVALKFLPGAMVQDRDAKERLVQEAQAASALDHPNICTVFEIDETADGRLFIAMAYYEGQTLKARLANGPLPIDQAIDLFTGVVRAVAAAHQAGIVHRDIKPANIIVTSRGDVKLLDFGIAKLEGQNALTRTGTTLGTVMYMAPEQVTGRGVDARADVWSLGVVLFEMLAGRTPFAAPNDAAVMHKIVNEPPPSLASFRPEVSAAIVRIVSRALASAPEARFASAGELLGELEALRAAPATTAAHAAAPTAAKPGSRAPWLIVAAILIALAGAGGWYAYQQSRLREAHAQLAALAALIQKEQPAQAYRLMRRLEPALANDPDFIKVRDGFLLPASIRTTPPDADVYVTGYSELDAEWQPLGRSPIETRLPRNYFRYRITKPGFATLEVARGTGELSFTLSREGTLPAGMVLVSGGNAQLTEGTAPFGEFFLDKYEVTNAAYKKFVDAGGYRSREFWRDPFVKDGRVVTFEAAMAEFRDATGRPGPSTWELGAYPDGQGEVPVHGISWYEAAAYARFAGKLLPTVHHWRRAAGLGIFSNVLELSNFTNKAPAAAGTFKGIGEYGTYDMAGNVKEWCANAIGPLRYILGGAWNEPNYQYAGADARGPFDRSAQNGMRLMQTVGAVPLPAKTLEPIARLVRDYSLEKPVSDETFHAYARQFEYDRSDLKSAVESTDDSPDAWRVERITYNAAYNNERISAYLFLPKNARPPYQTVVYVPHSGGFALRRFEQAEMSYLAFLVKSGRALLFPMYKGMYERLTQDFQPGPAANRDATIERVKDLRRSIDYLATRQDIAQDRLAYFGVSYGAGLAPLVLAVEDRFKTAVVWSGGFSKNQGLTEVDPFNYARHVRTPILMLNGRDDFNFPVEESQRPMFKALGTPAADKKYVLFEGGHIFPFNRIQKDTLDWLDQRLGIPQQ